MSETEGKKSAPPFLAWWKINPAELEKQVVAYDTLKYPFSARGTSTNYAAGSAWIALMSGAQFHYGDVFALTMFWEFIVWPVLAFFMFRGHRWAFKAGMIVGTLGIGLSLIGGSAVVIALTQGLAWVAYMRWFALGYRVETIRKGRLLASPREPVALSKEGNATNEQDLHDSNSTPSLGGASTAFIVASRGQRFVNIVLDLMFYLIFAFILAVGLDLAGLLESLTAQNSILLGVIVVFIYYVPQEAFSGRTLGKLITGTKAVNLNGGELSFGRALGRTLGRFIPFEQFSFFGGNGGPRGWHDNLSKTMVISVRKSQKALAAVS